MKPVASSLALYLFGENLIQKLFTSSLDPAVPRLKKVTTISVEDAIFKDQTKAVGSPL